MVTARSKTIATVSRGTSSPGFKGIAEKSTAFLSVDRSPGVKSGNVFSVSVCYKLVGRVAS